MSTPTPHPEGKSTYTQGYHASVTRSHISRTAATDAAFLLPHLQPHFKILDIGCGPGTITAGLAAAVPNGHVTGIDLGAAVITQARTLHPPSSHPNLTFAVGDILSGLPYADASFDVVFTHQALLHIPTPETAFREMKRLLKHPGGLLAAREGDCDTFLWYPDPSGALALWSRSLIAMARHTGADPLIGRRLHALAAAAGWERGKMKLSTSTSMYSGVEEADWWGGLLAERFEKSEVRERVREAGFSEEEIGRMVRALREWGACEDAWFAIMQCEILAWT